MAVSAFSRLSRRAATLAALVGVAGAFNTLPAAPALATPLSTHTFSYADMPDIDQERITGFDSPGGTLTYHAGLPNGGKMYCAVTSAMDALAFIADHGGSIVSPGTHVWTAAGNYETMTAKLSEMGGLMSTSSTNGTTQTGFESGLTSWNTRYGTAQHHFGLVSEFPGTGDDWQAPNLGIATLAEAFGNPVIVRIGYYKAATVTIAGKPVSALQRTGGHMVAMTGFDNTGLNFMDPDDVGGSFTQSAYANRTQAVSPVTAVFTDGSGNPYRSGGQTETYLHMPGYGGGSAYVEGYTVIQPSFTLTAKSSFFTVFKDGISTNYKYVGAGSVADAQLSPAGDSAYYAMTDSKTIYKLNLSTGVSTPLTKVSAAVSSLAVNTAGDTIYAAAGRKLAAVSNKGTTVAKTTLPSDVAAIAYDPVRGQVDAVTPKTKSVMVLASSLATQGSLSLPASAVKNATDVDATVNPANGKLTIKAAGIASIVVSAPLPPTTPVNPVASIANSPVVMVTPVAKIPSKAILGTLVAHSAASTRAASSIATASPIVRMSHSVPTTGIQAEQAVG